MAWYFLALFRDRRFRIAAGVGAASLLLIVGAYLIGASWAFKAAAVAFFLLFLPSIVAVFVVLGLVVRADYLERQGRS